MNLSLLFPLFRTPATGETPAALHCRAKLEGHQLGVVSVDVDPSGTCELESCLALSRMVMITQTLNFFTGGVSSSLDNTIKIWDLVAGSLTKTIDAGPGRFISFMHIPPLQLQSHFVVPLWQFALLINLNVTQLTPGQQQFLRMRDLLRRVATRVV